MEFICYVLHYVFLMFFIVRFFEQAEPGAVAFIKYVHVRPYSIMITHPKQ